MVSLSRGGRTPYVTDDAWEQVEQVLCDREAEDAAGTFPDRVADLGPDAVVDMLCFTLASATSLVQRLRGHVGHLVHCGSIWRYGPSLRVPIPEEGGTAAVGRYGVQKEIISEFLENETRSGGLVTTALHPGHISGPGWAPIGPVGNKDPDVWRRLSAGEEVLVPGLGAELMHHVHADDVAQAFQLALEHREAAAGESFNVVAASALTVRGLSQLGAGWFGRRAHLRYVSWDEFRASTTPDQAEMSWDHLWRSHYASIEKARTALGYVPRYAPEEAVLDGVRSLIERGELQVAAPLRV